MFKYFSVLTNGEKGNKPVGFENLVTLRGCGYIIQLMGGLMKCVWTWKRFRSSFHRKLILIFIM